MATGQFRFKLISLISLVNRRLSFKIMSLCITMFKLCKIYVALMQVSDDRGAPDLF